MPCALSRGAKTGCDGDVISDEAMGRLVKDGFNAITKKALRYPILPDIDFQNPTAQTCAKLTPEMVVANAGRGITTWQKRRGGEWYVETFNSAVVAGSWFIVGVHREIYIVRGSKVGVIGTPGILYVASGAFLEASQELRFAKVFRDAMVVDLALTPNVDDVVVILASCGEKMSIRDGDLIMRSDNGFYSVTEKAAKATYDWNV